MLAHDIVIFCHRRWCSMLLSRQRTCTHFQRKVVFKGSFCPNLRSLLDATLPLIIVMITLSYGTTLMFTWLSMLRYQGSKMLHKPVMPAPHVLTQILVALRSCFSKLTRNWECQVDCLLDIEMWCIYALPNCRYQTWASMHPGPTESFVLLLSTHNLSGQRWGLLSLCPWLM